MPQAVFLAGPEAAAQIHVGLEAVAGEPAKADPVQVFVAGLLALHVHRGADGTFRAHAAEAAAGALDLIQIVTELTMKHQEINVVLNLIFLCLRISMVQNLKLECEAPIRF